MRIHQRRFGFACPSAIPEYGRSLIP
jgi:hypothetical protein